MKKFFPAGHQVTTNDYPYGRLRCTATFGMEFKPGKGYRSTFQTINPKNGRVNAVKRSTYADFMLFYQDTETGHVNYSHFNIRGEDDVNRVAMLADAQFASLSAEEVQWLYGTMINCLRITAAMVVQYSGADREQVLAVIEPSVTAAIAGMKTGTNQFAHISVDCAALENCRKPGYTAIQTTVGPVSILSL